MVSFVAYFKFAYSQFSMRNRCKTKIKVMTFIFISNVRFKRRWINQSSKKAGPCIEKWKNQPKYNWKQNKSREFIGKCERPINRSINSLVKFLNIIACFFVSTLSFSFTHDWMTLCDSLCCRWKKFNCIENNFHWIPNWVCFFGREWVHNSSYSIKQRTSIDVGYDDDDRKCILCQRTQKKHKQNAQSARKVVHEKNKRRQSTTTVDDATIVDENTFA